MKLIKHVSFFFFCLLCFTSYANENKYIFISETNAEGKEKPAFILEILDSDLGDRMKICEDGEVYLKVDKVLAFPKKSLLLSNPLTNTTILQQMFENVSESRDDDEYIKCSNPKCRHYYYARPGHRDCPRCGTEN